MSIPEWLQGMLKDGRYQSYSEMSYDWRIPEETIRRWAKGERRPSVSNCIRLARATGTPLEEVVTMAGLADDGDGARGPLPVKA